MYEGKRNEQRKGCENDFTLLPINPRATGCPSAKCSYLKALLKKMPGRPARPADSIDSRPVTIGRARCQRCLFGRESQAWPGREEAPALATHALPGTSSSFQTGEAPPAQGRDRRAPASRNVGREPADCALATKSFKAGTDAFLLEKTEVLKTVDGLFEAAAAEGKGQVFARMLDCGGGGGVPPPDERIGGEAKVVGVLF